MKTVVRGLVFAALLGVIAAPVVRSGQSDRPTDGYWSCYTGAEADPVYFSAVWEARAMRAEVHAAFLKFLADKYGFKGRVSCSISTKGATDLTKAQANALEMQKHWLKQGKKVVDTGWTFDASGAPARGGVQAAPPTSAAATHWAACKIDRLAPGAKSVVTGPYNAYISDVFSFDPKTPDLVRKFGEFVSSNYGQQRDTPLCNVRTSEESVRAMHKGWIDEANKAGKAILTGWRYGQQ